ncbi:MAG: hypothetical protein DRP82_00690 [Planctomycetota bacterium]|nr:MAG: hypothetical protein DRP82_00690 [Planctomycetota bacterium]
MVPVLRGLAVVLVCAGAILVTPRIRVTYDAWRLMHRNTAVLGILDKERRRRILERFIFDGVERYKIRLPIVPSMGGATPYLGEPVRMVLFLGSSKGKKGPLNGEMVTLNPRGNVLLIVADATTKWFSVERFLQHLKEQKLLQLCPELALAVQDERGNLLWAPMELQVGKIRLGWEGYYYLVLYKGAAYVNGDAAQTPEQTYNLMRKIKKGVVPTPRFRLIVEWRFPYGVVTNHVCATLASGCPLYYHLFGEKEVPDIYNHFRAIDDGVWKEEFGPPEEEPIGEEEGDEEAEN